MPFGFEITFALIFVGVILVASGANWALDRVLAEYRRSLGDDPSATTEWSRRVEAARTRIEAQSLRRISQGEPPLDKDAELKRALGVTENA